MSQHTGTQTLLQWRQMRICWSKITGDSIICSTACPAKNKRKRKKERKKKENIKRSMASR